jgi:hypothetical protein
MLTDELESLVRHLRDLDRPVVSWLRPGVEPGRVVGALRSEAPPSVTEWFAWCDGVEGWPGQLQDDVNVIPGYSPVSVEEAVEMKSSYAGDPMLGDNWLPLLTTATGDIYAAVWSPGSDARVAGVLVGEATEIEFQTIEQMVTVFNACFDSGAFGLDAAGRLVMNPEGYDEVYEGVVAG